MKVQKGSHILVRVKVSYDDIEGYATDIDNVCKAVLKRARHRIVDAIALYTEEKNSYIEKEYEGGIDTWFGPGSVMLSELGLEMVFKYNDEFVTLTLRTVGDTHD